MLHHIVLRHLDLTTERPERPPTSTKAVTLAHYRERINSSTRPWGDFLTWNRVVLETGTKTEEMIHRAAAPAMKPRQTCDILLNHRNHALRVINIR